MLKNHLKKAAVYKNQSVSYQEIMQYAHCYSESFKQHSNPQKVMIFGENSLEWIYAVYACFKNDAIVIPVDIQSTVSEMKYILRDCQPDMIFVTDNKRAYIESILATSEIKSTIVSPFDIDCKNVDRAPIVSFTPNNLQKTAFIIYTSGTTASSKGVMLSYENILYNINAVCNEIPIITKERNVMILLPLHHVFPLLGSLVAPLYIGGTVYIAESLNAESILSTLNEGKINLIIGVPRLYEILAKGVMEKINAHWLTKTVYKTAYLLQSRWFSTFIFKSVHKKFGGHIDYLVSGGAALPKDTAKIFKTLGFYVLEGYGMTETAPMISFTHPGKWKIGYAGLPLRGIEVKTEDGEICVKGANVMQGYYNRLEETVAIIKNGWLHTGDLGIIDKYGIQITGRLKDIIVTSNGKNINPEELETAIIRTTPYIKEIGIFMQDNILQALIYPEMTQIRAKSSTDLNQLIQEAVLEFNKEISPYKRIKRFHIISEELPKTRLGKIQRFKLNDYIVKRKEERQNNISKNCSEEYLILKTFVDKETGYIANENDHFEIDLAMDSLTRVALIAFIENSFGIALSEEHLNDLNTLAILSEYITQNRDKLSYDKNITWKEILSVKIPSFKIPKSGLTHQGMKRLASVIFNLIYRFKSQGVKNIPNEPCIIVANHQSVLDGLFITSLMKRKIHKKTYFFAKEKHWKSGFMQFMARKNNVILMDINKNVKETLQKLSYLLQEKKNVVIFPEGTRSKEGLKEFKEAFAILSKTLNVPVVPVVISVSNRVVYNRIRLPRYLAPIRVEFLPPVFPTEEDNIYSFKSKIRQMIADKINY